MIIINAKKRAKPIWFALKSMIEENPMTIVRTKIAIIIGVISEFFINRKWF